MNIAIDISPISDLSNSSHKIRGVGSYIKLLMNGLKKYDNENKYEFIDNKKFPGGVELIHYPYFDPFFITLPFFSSKKNIVTIHDLTPLVFPEYFPPGIRGGIRWQIQKQLLKKIDCVITDSISSKNDILKFTNLPEHRVFVVYLCADLVYGPISLGSEEIKRMRKKYSLPEEFGLYVGDVTRNKNLPRLVEAARRADIPFVMVGKALVERRIDLSNPWNRDLAKVRLQLERSPKISTLGLVPIEDLVKLYNMATFLAMPSLYEGFGLPVLEAMKSGCPVVSAGCGSISEIGGEAAYYVDPFQVDSIKEGMLEVFNNSVLQKKLREKGLIQSKKFSLQKMVEDTVDIYRKILT